MTKKLHYFEFNGLAEPIRYMLYYSGQSFEDIRHDRKIWPIIEIKNSLPYGQLPVYEEGDRKLNQSIAITRYLASQTGLLPSDPWEQAVLDAAVLNLKDFELKARSYIMESDPVKREQLKNELLTETSDYYLSRFENELKANIGYFGGKVHYPIADERYNDARLIDYFLSCYHIALLFLILLSYFLFFKLRG